jgi:hypothetical protein
MIELKGFYRPVVGEYISDDGITYEKLSKHLYIDIGLRCPVFLAKWILAFRQQYFMEGQFMQTPTPRPPTQPKPASPSPKTPARPPVRA